MLTLLDILAPGHVDLALATTDLEEGIGRLAGLLQGSEGVTDRAALQAALQRSGKPIGAQSILSHVRTDHVSTMIMAAGRLAGGKKLAMGSTPADPTAAVEDIHFLFLIAVPMTLASEYLRLVGALARSLLNPAVVARLREVDDAREFVHILCTEVEEF